MFRKSYLIYGTSVEIDSDIRKAMELVDGVINFFSDPAPKKRNNTIQIHIKASDHSSIADVKAKTEGVPQLFSFDRLKGYRVDDSLILIDGYSAAKCDTSRGVGDILLNLKTLEFGRFFPFIFFYILLVEMLRYRGLYYVHASCVSAGGKAVLVPGDTGVGKSTICITLVREGYNYLSDDGVLLRDESDGVSVLSLPGDFHIDPAISERFHELEGVKKAKKYGEGPKRSFKPEEFYPQKFALEVKQGYIIFPEITDEDKTCIVKLSKAETLAMLIPNSLLVMMDREIAPSHLATLKKLTEHSKAFRFKSGRDLLINPSSVVSMIKREIFMEPENG